MKDSFLRQQHGRRFFSEKLLSFVILSTDISENLKSAQATILQI
jgi:hypothetical protein